jgi:hypothetical protein
MEYQNVFCIPFRNREEHLQTFLNKAWPLIKTQFPNSLLVIIEQDKKNEFNRGALLNIGFQEYGQKATWFITHDVDMCPKEETLKRTYVSELFDILRIYNAHDTSLGGICKIRSSVFSTINGFPNHIWGWGIEDRALFYRAKVHGFTMSPNMKNASQYTILPHKSNARSYTGEQKQIHQEEEHNFHSCSKEEQLKHFEQSGLSNLRYKLFEKTIIHGSIVHIKVFLEQI